MMEDVEELEDCKGCKILIPGGIDPNRPFEGKQDNLRSSADRNFGFRKS